MKMQTVLTLMVDTTVPVYLDTQEMEHIVMVMNYSNRKSM